MPLRSLIIAFSTFSQIPMPNVEWKPESMRYMMCFFPLVGVVIGLLLVGWVWLSNALGFGPILRGAGIVLIPAAVSGGIHLDGFADTCDALASNAGPERRAEILKDSHTGAFAVIGLCMYFVAYFAFAVELDSATQLLPLVVAPFLSRCLSGIATVSFAPGVGKGMQFEFHNSASRRSVLIILVSMTVASAIVLLAANPIMGICMMCVGLLCLGGLYLLSENSFMGMSGDLAGFFLQMCELLLLACIVVVGKLMGV